MSMAFYPDCEHLLGRRAFLRNAATFAAWSFLPRIASSASHRDPRLLAIILRGALDGLATIVPVGDPGLAKLRREIALSGSAGGDPLALDSFFAINPALPFFHSLFLKGEATAIHALATPYRERSHFDGQDMLESGYPAVGKVESGWLNRMVEHIKTGEQVRAEGLSVGAAPPLVFKGKAPVVTWSPVPARDIPIDTLNRLLALYADTDQPLRDALELHLERDDGGVQAASNPQDGLGKSGLERSWISAALGAAKFMAKEDGPRIAALSFDGWDTHANEGPVNGRLARMLRALDQAIAGFAGAMGESWRETSVVIITEFGRTAAENGTEGTDHGTGSVCLLAGGAVKGGKVLADWPGLAANQLYQGRDLAPTTDLRAVLKGMMRDQFGLDKTLLDTIIFPQSADVKAMDDLIRA